MRTSAIIALWTLLSGPALHADWRAEYGAARVEAKRTNQPLVIVASTDHCPWCDKQAAALCDPETVLMLEAGFVRLKLHTAKDADLLRKMKVESYPTTIIAAPDGKILDTLCGYHDAAQVKAALRRALR